MPRVAAALTAVGVPVVATADLDLLSDAGKLKKLVVALGAKWSSELAELWTQATNDIRSQREPVTVADVQVAIAAVLNWHEASPFTPELQERLKAQIRTKGSRWGPVKMYGTSAFSGSARAAVDRLLDELDNTGVVLVRDGELECLAPEVTVAKGPEWLPSALESEAHRNAAAQSHVRRIRTAAQQLIQGDASRPAAGSSGQET